MFSSSLQYIRLPKQMKHSMNQWLIINLKSPPTKHLTIMLKLQCFRQIKCTLFNKILCLFSRCCICGVMTAPNPSNTCVSCLKSQIDISEGIPKQLVMQHCRDCDRYNKPPWTKCELESPELLTLCLKQIKGLKRVKLVDAGFVWTEPHSKRIKVKLTI